MSRHGGGWKSGKMAMAVGSFILFDVLPELAARKKVIFQERDFRVLTKIEHTPSAYPPGLFNHTRFCLNNQAEGRAKSDRVS